MLEINVKIRSLYNRELQQNILRYGIQKTVVGPGNWRNTLKPKPLNFKTVLLKAGRMCFSSGEEIIFNLQPLFQILETENCFK